MGFEPISFSDPLEAMEEFALEPLAVDFLITDFDMPQLAGDALLAQVRALRPDMPLLLCSGRTQLAQLAATLQVPALSKPFDAAALQRAIISALTAKQGSTGESQAAP